MKHHFCLTTNHKCNATLQMNFPLSEEVFIPSYEHLNTTNRMPFLLVSAAFYSTNYPHGPFRDPDTPSPGCSSPVLDAH